jgi:hypothetical protein
MPESAVVVVAAVEHYLTGFLVEELAGGANAGKKSPIAPDREKPVWGDEVPELLAFLNCDAERFFDQDVFASR